MFEKMKNSKKKKTKEDIEMLSSLPAFELKTTDEKKYKTNEIAADSFFDKYSGRRMYSVNGSITTVEVLALDYYKRFNYTGIHGENLILPALYNIFLWDIIYYDNIPLVFQSPFQTFPLDFFYTDFYVNRKDLIDGRLKEISEYSADDIRSYIESIYLNKKNTRCAFVIWNHLYNERDTIIKIAISIGAKILSGIFSEFAKNLKFMLKGMPDLFLWQESKEKNGDSQPIEASSMLVEVKSKNDKLSEHQKYWLEIFDKYGLNAEVLHII
jgi:Fanconi-associated nuclease 1